MKYFIGFNKRSLPSARLLKNALSALIPEHTFVLSNRPRDTVLISYGNTDFTTSIHNSQRFIYACSNKLVFSKIMEAHKILSPIYKQGKPTFYPCIVRTVMNGSGGIGIHVFETEESYIKENLNPIFHWSEFVFVDKEYRVHVLGGKVAKIFVKKCAQEEEDKLPIRNLKRGYHFSLLEKTYEKLTQVVQRLEDTFKEEGLTPSYYALDCGYIKGKGWFIFEANTAPGLNDKTVELYAQYLAAALNLKEESKNDILRTTEDTNRIGIPEE